MKDSAAADIGNRQRRNSMKKSQDIQKRACRDFAD
jgi:hypothetical protein